MNSGQARPHRVSVVVSDPPLGEGWVRDLETERIQATCVAQSRIASLVPSDADALLLLEPDLSLPPPAELDRLSGMVGLLVAASGSNAIARARWLDQGADDFLQLPAQPTEVAARLRAVIRRYRSLHPTAGTFVIGRLSLELFQRRATLDGTVLDLTTGEFNLLAHLARRAGHVSTREELVEVTKGSTEEAFERSIDVHVSRLRAKLGDNPRNPQWLKTVRGRGYLLSLS